MKKIIYSNLDLLFEKLEALNKEERELRKNKDFVLIDISKIKENKVSNTTREVN